jgi:hypothetical protein
VLPDDGGSVDVVGGVVVVGGDEVVVGVGGRVVGGRVGCGGEVVVGVGCVELGGAGGRLLLLVSSLLVDVSTCDEDSVELGGGGKGSGAGCRYGALVVDVLVLVGLMVRSGLASLPP